MPYSSLQGGLSMGGCFFSYKPRTPGSRGVVHRGVLFQLQTAYSRFRGGVGHGGVLFQLQTAYSRFRRKKPVQRAVILGASRLNWCTDFPAGGGPVRPDPETLAPNTPDRPF